MAGRAWRPRHFRWRLAAPLAEADRRAQQIGTAPLVAQMLHNRGIVDVAAAKSFLRPQLTDLHNPELLPGAAPAAELIARAIAEKHRIVLYGDYDVDGITGVSILHACLTMLGADVHYYVPHRLEEGYGLNVKAVEKLIARQMQMLITVDCGISAVEPIALARSAGVETIVTDHHSPPPVLPDAHAIVHPAPHGGAVPAEPLAGAGVAFKLAWQVAKTICGNARVDETMRTFLLDATCLAALGTIADVVPLIGENRVLSTWGLRGLPATKHVGLRALLSSSGLAEGKLDAYHVGFVLAPRLNACGRMGHARLAVEMLTTTDAARAGEIAAYLAEQNTERQRVEREIAQQAVDMVVSRGLHDPARRAIILASSQWHGGVIGIVASRLVDRFGRPAILIALDKDGLGQGSARSIPGFHMRDALEACSKHLLSFGGHAMAGGMRIRAEDVDAFTASMLACAERTVKDEQLAPMLDIDAEASLAALSYPVVEHISRMAPFGPGNAEPVVAVRGCRVLTPAKRVGKGGQTVSIVLGQNGCRMRAVGFGMGDLADGLAGIQTLDVAGHPKLNSFNGNTTVELELRDVVWE